MSGLTKQLKSWAEYPRLATPLWGLLSLVLLLACSTYTVRQSKQISEDAPKEALLAHMSITLLLSDEGLSAEEATQVLEQGIVESARKETEEISSRARRDMDLAKKAVVDDLYRQASELSFEIAEKVIQKNLSPQDHQGLVDACIAKYEKESG